MSYLSADELVAKNSADTNSSWESKLDYELATEIIGHSLSEFDWVELQDALDEAVFEVVMSFKND